MISYQKEMFARERIQTLQREAALERMASRGAARRSRALPWRTRIALAIGRRLGWAAAAY